MISCPLFQPHVVLDFMLHFVIDPRFLCVVCGLVWSRLFSLMFWSVSGLVFLGLV